MAGALEVADGPWGSMWGALGFIAGSFWVPWGALWDALGVIWSPFGVLLGPFGALWASCWVPLGVFGLLLGAFGRRHGSLVAKRAKEENHQISFVLAVFRHLKGPMLGPSAHPKGLDGPKNFNIDLYTPIDLGIYPQ